MTVDGERHKLFSSLSLRIKDLQSIREVWYKPSFLCCNKLICFLQNTVGLDYSIL